MAREKNAIVVAVLQEQLEGLGRASQDLVAHVVVLGLGIHVRVHGDIGYVRGENVGERDEQSQGRECGKIRGTQQDLEDGCERGTIPDYVDIGCRNEQDSDGREVGLEPPAIRAVVNGVSRVPSPLEIGLKSEPDHEQQDSVSEKGQDAGQKVCKLGEASLALPTPRGLNSGKNS